MIHAINAVQGSDPAQVLADLSTLGSAVQPHPGVLYFELDAPPEAHDAIEAFGWCAGCCCALTTPCRLDLVETQTIQQVGETDWHLAYLSGDYGLTEYRFDADGAGVPIYMVDTLANPAGADMGGRLTVIHDPTGVPLSVNHGTLTAGWAAGAVHGAAKGALVFNAAGFNGAGSATVQTLNAALAACLTHKQANYPGQMAVCSNSWSSSGFALPDPFSAVISALVAEGVLVVCSSGNDSIDFDALNLTNVWPAMNPQTLTVGAHDKLDARANFSNQGSPVKIHAPGVSCAALDHNGNLLVGSGTSVSAPLVAGSLACLISAGETDPEAKILADAVLGRLTNKQAGPDGVLFKDPGLAGLPAQPATGGYDGGDASTTFWQFEADGGNAATVYNVNEDYEDAA